MQVWDLAQGSELWKKIIRTGTEFSTSYLRLKINRLTIHRFLSQGMVGRWVSDWSMALRKSMEALTNEASLVDLVKLPIWTPRGPPRWWLKTRQ